LHVGRIDLIHSLKQEGRSSTGSREQARTRRVLVVTEFALSLVLMIAAGLLLHSFWDLLNVRLGFNPEQVMAIKTRMPYPNDTRIDIYRTASQQTPFFREVLRRCRALPGVEEAAFGDLGSLPLGHDRNNQNPPVPMVIEGRRTESNEASLVDESIVTPEYFHLMGIALQRGRLFTDFDNDKSENVAVINEAMAETYWPNEDPLGKHVKLSRRATEWTTIVGVVANALSEGRQASGDIFARQIEYRRNPRAGPRAGAIHRLNASCFRRRVAHSDCVRVARTKAVHIGNGWAVCSDRTLSRGDRNLRSHFLHCDRADPRDRDSSRARGVKVEHSPDSSASGIASRDCWCGVWVSWRSDGLALNGRPALRGAAHGPADLCRCRFPFPRCRSPGLLPPCAPRHARRSHRRSEI